MSSTTSPRLPVITAYARSGALEHAWRMFREAGLDRVNDDPAVLSVRGRLLKDRALAEPEEEGRRRFYREAASAYARAAELPRGGTYPAINAATLSLLAGDVDVAHVLARRILSGSEDRIETAYYRSATRAEALLLLGRIDDARRVLGEAVARAPKAYEDHASTLRQFALILSALGEDERWLDAFRPPRALHFAGHMSLSGDEAELRTRVEAAIAAEQIGFGYGALAAGADILVAEALLDAGAELHLILPAAPAAFRAASVAAFGEAWSARFARVLEAADSVRAIAAEPAPPTAPAICLAEEVAMGAAVMQAEALATEAIQLLLQDPSAAARGEGEATARVAEAWRGSGRRQRLEPATRAEAPTPAPPAPSGLVPAALVRIELAGLASDILIDRALPRLARVLGELPGPLVPARWTGEILLAAFDHPARAARAALGAVAALADIAEVKVSASYALARRAEDPFGGAPVLLGPGLGLVRDIALSTPPGAVHVTEDFAAALHGGPRGARPRTEYVGELPADEPGVAIRLYSLRP